ncbi:deoxyuridine 5'-triphosphate nucleotidohydrolase-like [Brevipalpus obovatus]|uniref:deoxyuridine 5'-triphosphate nucleotidohydrolase-like n=1 Tax=Brevipalpus obovatus TaxID=246614 RepID=UPI003D9FA0C9
MFDSYLPTSVMNFFRKLLSLLGSPFHGSPAVLQFRKLSPNAIEPTRASELSAGFDLYSAADHVIPSKGKALIPTDLQIAVPSNCYGRVAPRSGLAHKHFIDVGAGVIDADYRGNLGVILFNFGDKEFQVNRGDRIAQLICERIEYPVLKEMESLDETVRGGGGFGSTGK